MLSKLISVAFCLAYPANCLAKGEAVLMSQVAVPAKFFIEARDYEANIRVNGKDKFSAFFVPEGAGDDQKFHAIVKDMEDGTYQVAFNHKKAGYFILHILNGDLPIRNSPFTHVVNPGPTIPAKCRVEGDGIVCPKSGFINSFLIVAVDQFDNQQSIGGEPFTVTIIGGNNPIPVFAGMKSPFVLQ
jgi:hypothetical protein